MMELPLGGIDLNREHFEISTESEYKEEYDNPSTGYRGCSDPFENDNVGAITTEAPQVTELPVQQEEEPEEGEISDDNEQVIESNEGEGKHDSFERNESSPPITKEESSSTSRTTYARWPGRSNGDGKQGNWNWRSEASAYSGQPDKFYQFAWAKGVQGSPRESVEDSPQDESLDKKKIDADISFHKSAPWSGNKDMEHLSERKSAWIVGDRGIEYVSYLRSDDGYIYLQDGGDRADQRNRKGRIEKGSSDRMPKNISDDKYKGQTDERNYLQERDHRRINRSSKDDRRRDNRGEVDLEEGEIHGKQLMLGDRYMKGRDRHFMKPIDRLPMQSNSLSNSKGRRDYDASPAMSESQREKLFMECTDLLRNASVKDAQKSFVVVCKQLRQALKILNDLNRRLPGPSSKNMDLVNHQRRIFSLTRDAFSGIRAAYAVRNTAIGKEQEQNTDAFPRLLDLASTRCQGLFTSKQLQELESMMQTAGYRGRNDFAHKTHRKGFPYEADKIEDKDMRFGESSGNASATTQVESESTSDNSANGRTLETGDEAEQLLKQSTLPHLVNGIQAVHLGDNNLPGNVGYGGWFPFSPDQVDVQCYGDTKEKGLMPSSIPTSVVDSMNKSYYLHRVGGTMDSRQVNISERDIPGASNKSNAFLSHMDPVKALTSYHEKFAGKSHTAYNRLPSPTPSDEDEEASTSCKNATLGSNEGTQPVKTIESSGIPEFQPNISVPPIEDKVKDNSEKSSLPELTLFPSSEILVGDAGDSEARQTKLFAAKNNKKNRDPRRRLANQSMELELSQPDNGGSEVKPSWLSECVRKASSEANEPRPSNEGDLFSLLTLGSTGGWLSEEQAAPSSIPEGSMRMDTDEQVMQVNMNEAKDLFDGANQRKRQHDSLGQENAAKRMKPAPGANLPVTPSGLDTIPANELKQVATEESVLSQENIQPKQPVPVSESTAKDTSKLKMKPRDPRRALLGGGANEKSKNIECVTAKNNVSNTTVGVVTQTSNVTTQPIMAPILIEKKPVASPTTVVASLPSRNEQLPGVEGNNVLLESLNTRQEDFSRPGKPSGIATRVPINKPSGKLDLNLSNTSAPQQKEIVSHWDQLESLLEGLDEKQKQAVRQERARRIEEQTRMFNARKLCLVLDLDHTLLNSAKFSEIEGEWEAKLRANEMAERAKFGKDGVSRRELYRFAHMGMWTKLRPGIWNFLARASNLYELHVYTMGNKAYATEMAKLLDPTGTLFAGRVISKGDDGDVVDGDERLPKSKDLDGVLGMESAVVIIDDSARVWPHHRHNLIVVERYMYFPCSRKQFGLPGPSLLEVGHDEREQDGMLASALAVIEKIHYNFFSNPRLHDVDVRDILAKEQRRVLAGCKLIFSRVFPQGEIQPHLHPLWQLAEQFGAICSLTMDEGVTHVVAISLGTDKVNWALSTGRFVVRPGWLEASAILYRRANERDFAVLP